MSADTLGVSGDFCIRSPEWKFLYTLCIRIRVDAGIRIFLYTLTSQYQNQSFFFNAHVLLTNPLRCPDTNRIRVDGRIQFVYATCGRRYCCIRIKKFADTKISGYKWTGPQSRLRLRSLNSYLCLCYSFLFLSLGLHYLSRALIFGNFDVFFGCFFLTDYYLV